jgi:hypothetical protein
MKLFITLFENVNKSRTSAGNLSLMKFHEKNSMTSRYLVSTVYYYKYFRPLRNTFASHTDSVKSRTLRARLGAQQIPQVYLFTPLFISLFISIQVVFEGLCQSSVECFSRVENINYSIKN